MGQIFRRDLGHERDLHAFQRFLGGEIFFQRFLFQASHPAKKIHLVGRAHIETIRREHAASVELGDSARESLTNDARGALNTGKKFRALNAILSARLFDAQRGNSQIAIILQRQADQTLQSWIIEEIAPINVGCGSVGRIALRRASGPRTAHRRGRPIIFGHHRATAQERAQAKNTELPVHTICSLPPPEMSVPGSRFGACFLFALKMRRTTT